MATEPIRVYEDDRKRIEARGSMGDTYPEAVESILDELEELEARLEDDDTHRSPNEELEEDASA